MGTNVDIINSTVTGILVTLAHFFMLMFLSIYGGLGFDRNIVWFAQNVWAQPGISVAKLFEFKAYENTVFAVNGIVYFIVGFLAFEYYRRKSNKKTINSDEANAV